MKYLLLVSLIVSFIVYLPLSKRKACYNWKCWLDDKIPFQSIFVIPYVFFFIWIMGIIGFLWNRPNIENFLFSYLVLVNFSNLFWYLVPNGVIRPKQLHVNSHFEKAVDFFHKYDGDTNGLPSGHVSHTLLSTFYLSQVYTDHWWIWIVAGLISVSTVFVKQHYLIDLVLTPMFVLAAILVEKLLHF